MVFLFFDLGSHLKSSVGQGLQRAAINSGFGERYMSANILLKRFQQPSKGLHPKNIE
jgi:hypothetical protein